MYADGFDPNDLELQYFWDLGDGRTAEGSEIEVAYSQPGPFQVTLRVVNSAGVEGGRTWSRWVLVNDETHFNNNHEPYSTILQPTHLGIFNAEESLTFSGTAFDADEDAVTFYWDFGDGFLATGNDLQHSYDQILSENETVDFFVQMIARDAKGLFDTYGDGIDIILYDGMRPVRPIIVSPELEDDAFEIGKVFLEPGQTLTLKGALEGMSQTAGYQATWYLSSLEDEFMVEGFEPAPIPHERFKTETSYNVTLYVADESGNESILAPTFELRVLSGEEPPSFVEILQPPWDEPLEVGDGLELVGYVEEEDDLALSYQWKITQVDSEAAPLCLEGEFPGFVPFDQAGLYRIEMTVTTARGDVVSAIPRYIPVIDEEALEEQEKEPPYICRVIPTEQQTLIPQKSSLAFQAQTTLYSGGSVNRYYWDFGPTRMFAGPNPAPVVYNQPGSFVVRAFVQDSFGTWSPYPAEWLVSVFEGNVPPRSEILEPALREHEDEYFRRLVVVEVGQPVTFVGRGLDADGAAIHNGNWFLDYELCDGCENTLQPPPFVFDEVGAYGVEFFVTDSGGKSDPFGDSRYIQVVDPSAQPETYFVEPAQDLTIEPGDPLYLFAFGEDPNDLEVTYDWTFPPEAILPVDFEVGDEDVYPVTFNEPSPDGQPYEIKVAAFTEINRDDTPAVLRVTVKRFEDSAFEPNNELSQAAPIQQGRYNSLSLGDGDSVDAFTFQIDTPGQDLELVFNAPQGAGNLEADLYIFQGNQWVLLPEAAFKTGSGSFQLENLAVGNYAVVISLSEAAKRRRMGLDYSFSVQTLKPSLYMPLLVADGNLVSSFGMINTTNTTADLVIQGLDNRGVVIVSTSRQLPARGRLFTDSLTFFGKSSTGVDKAREIAWVRVQSTQRLVGYTNAETVDKKQLMSVGAVKTLTNRALVPHVAAATQTWYTRAVMVNLTEGARDVAFDSTSGNVAVASNLKMDNQVDFRFNDLFAGQALPDWGEMVTADNKASLAGFELFGRVDGKQEFAGLEMSNARRLNPNFTRINRNLYFVHVAADTANFWTGLSLINLVDRPISVNLVAFDDNGNEVQRLDQTPIAARGKILSTTDQIFAGAQGVSWIKVESDEDLGGFELFGDHQSRRIAGFEAVQNFTNVLYFPHIQAETGKTWTGIALLNVGNEAVELNLETYNDKGELVHQSSESIAATTKWVRTIQMLYPNGTLPVGASYLRITGNRSTLAGFELFGSFDTKGGLGDQMAGLPSLRD